MWERFAFIGRRDAPVSPGTRVVVEMVERRLESFAEITLYGTSSTSDVAG